MNQKSGQFSPSASAQCQRTLAIGWRRAATLALRDGSGTPGELTLPFGYLWPGSVETSLQNCDDVTAPGGIGTSTRGYARNLTSARILSAAPPNRV